VYFLLKLEAHERNFISHAEDLLTDDLWSGWRNVLQADFAHDEFRDVWLFAKHLYAPSFVAFIEGMVDGIQGLAPA